MDTGNGMFEMLDKKQVDNLPKEDANNLFRIGEIVKIKQSRFRVHAIKPRKLILKLLPKKD